MSQIASVRLFELFVEYRSRPFLFVESSGNFGDELIWKGADRLAKLAGIDVRRVNHEQFMRLSVPPDTVIYVHGSGGINPWWSGRPITDFQKALATKAPLAILGPQSVHPDHAFLRASLAQHLDAALPRRVVLFAREAVSYEALRQCFPGVELYLEHDTALNLTGAELDGPLLPRTFVLHAIRQDKEGQVIADRDPLSLSVDPITFCQSFDEWIALHRSARRIVANRLHSAVVGALFGKPTVVLPNSYHKNRAIWEHSLRQRGVVWSDDLPVSPLGRMINATPPIRRLVGSAFTQRLLRVYVHKVRRKTFDRLT